MGHLHQHSENSKYIQGAFVTGILLNTLFVAAEFSAGIYYNSLSLLSDAGHNLSDVASLGLCLFAYRISRSKSTERFTYGYHKSTILASLINAVILLIAVGSIGWEAIQRFMEPENTNGLGISLVAGIGIIINAVSAMVFFREKDNDLNIKSAYLHLAADAMVSAGVVAGGLMIRYSGIQMIDPILSLLVMAVVIYSTWGLLSESLRLTLDAVPEHLSLEKIRDTALGIEGIKDIHHIHIWAMSTTRNAMTAHLVLEEHLSEEQAAHIKSILKHQLEHLQKHHATLETETRVCDDEHDD